MIELIKKFRKKREFSYKNTRFYIKLLILFLTVLGCVFIGISKWKVSSNFPKENFVTITLSRSYISEPDRDRSKDTSQPILEVEIPEEIEIYSSQASGISFKNLNGKNYIITADHFCNPTLGNFLEYFNPPGAEVTIVATDIDGIKYEAEHVYSDRKLDLCMLSTRERNVDNIPISIFQPDVGDQVYTVSAPLGISMEDVALHFDGYFSGCNSPSFCFFTIPATFGSSGSAILNKDNEIVGFILMSTRDINTVSIGPGPEAIIGFIEDASAYSGVDLR
tara:strand:- start:3228 stop:4061 length:834 start_codon:yes stop_codon:yes gene_type:complete